MALTGLRPAFELHATGGRRRGRVSHVYSGDRPVWAGQRRLGCSLRPDRRALWGDADRLTGVHADPSRRLRRCALTKTQRITPESDQLWLSRPPYVLIAQVLSADLEARPPTIEYALLDDDGSTLAEVAGELDYTWWANFQPLVRRNG